MAVIDHGHGYLQSTSPAARAPGQVHGMRCVAAFLAFWAAFLTIAWGVHYLVGTLF